MTHRHVAGNQNNSLINFWPEGSSATRRFCTNCGSHLVFCFSSSEQTPLHSVVLWKNIHTKYTKIGKMAYVHSSVTMPCWCSSIPGKLTIYSHWPTVISVVFKLKIQASQIRGQHQAFWAWKAPLPFTLKATLGWMKCLLVGQTLLSSSAIRFVLVLKSLKASIIQC